MTETIVARIAALKAAPVPELKAMWRDLFESEPPPYNRRFLESRLAYRIQELAYGSLKPATVRRLEALGEELDGGKAAVRRRNSLRPSDDGKSSSRVDVFWELAFARTGALMSALIAVRVPFWLLDPMIWRYLAARSRQRD